MVSPRLILHFDDGNRLEEKMGSSFMRLTTPGLGSERVKNNSGNGDPMSPAP
jgi:hypothetical protein